MNIHKLKQEHTHTQTHTHTYTRTPERTHVHMLTGSLITRRRTRARNGAHGRHNKWRGADGQTAALALVRLRLGP